MARRNPMRDEIAIVGLGSTEFRRDAGGISPAKLAAEACIAAVRDAGIEKREIDGVVGALEPISGTGGGLELVVGGIDGGAISERGFWEGSGVGI